MCDKPSSLQKGFTLIETLVALAIITAISLIAMGALAPWMSFKQKLDTDRRMQDIRQAVSAAYSDRAMTVERQPAGRLGLFVTSPVANGQCPPQEAAFQEIADYFSESPQQLLRDGYANPWCTFVSPSFSTRRDGVDLWYRNIAFVSTGLDGVLDPATQMRADGTMQMGGDDVAAVVSGREIQGAKLKETMRRMNKVALAYETYFTNRYLSNSARDISLYYFSRAYDTAGAVQSTGGTWSNAFTFLSSIGVGPADAVTAWELDNNIELGNHNESVNGVQVRSPATAGTGSLPYTALLRARLPSPPGTTAYATQVVVGSY